MMIYGQLENNSIDNYNVWRSYLIAGCKGQKMFKNLLKLLACHPDKDLLAVQEQPLVMVDEECLLEDHGQLYEDNNEKLPSILIKQLQKRIDGT